MPVPTEGQLLAACCTSNSDMMHGYNDCAGINMIKGAQESCDVSIAKPVLKFSRRIASAIVTSQLF